MATPIQLVQRNLGVPQTGVWDATTDGAIVAYQHGHHGPYPMSADGHPDPQTLANLGYYEPESIFSSKWRDYLAGGKHPSTFPRDVATAIDQVPRWAWAATAATFGVFAYLAYRSDKKRRKE